MMGNPLDGTGPDGIVVVQRGLIIKRIHPPGRAKNNREKIYRYDDIKVIPIKRHTIVRRVRRRRNPS